jgi:hypothetical protein
LEIDYYVENLNNFLDINYNYLRSSKEDQTMDEGANIKAKESVKVTKEQVKVAEKVI